VTRWAVSHPATVSVVLPLADEVIEIEAAFRHFGCRIERQFKIEPGHDDIVFAFRLNETTNCDDTRRQRSIVPANRYLQVHHRARDQRIPNTICGTPLR